MVRRGWGPLCSVTVPASLGSSCSRELSPRIGVGQPSFVRPVCLFNVLCGTIFYTLWWCDQTISRWNSKDLMPSFVFPYLWRTPSTWERVLLRFYSLQTCRCSFIWVVSSQGLLIVSLAKAALFQTVKSKPRTWLPQKRCVSRSFIPFFTVKWLAPRRSVFLFCLLWNKYVGRVSSLLFCRTGWPLMSICLFSFKLWNFLGGVSWSVFMTSWGKMLPTGAFAEEGGCQGFPDKMFTGLRGLWISCKYLLWVYETSAHKQRVCLSVAHWNVFRESAVGDVCAGGMCQES